jgi:hypothetical protein
MLHLLLSTISLGPFLGAAGVAWWLGRSARFEAHAVWLMALARRMVWFGVAAELAVIAFWWSRPEEAGVASRSVSVAAVVVTLLVVFQMLVGPFFGAAGMGYWLSRHLRLMDHQQLLQKVAFGFLLAGIGCGGVAKAGMVSIRDPLPVYLLVSTGTVGVLMLVFGGMMITALSTQLGSRRRNPAA